MGGLTRRSEEKENFRLMIPIVEDLAGFGDTSSMDLQ